MKIWFEILGDVVGIAAIFAIGYAALLIGHGMGVN